MTTVKLNAADLPKLQAIAAGLQTELAGFEDPAHDPELSALVFAWEDAKEEAARARDTARIRAATLDAELLARGITRYPYLDRAGIKRYAVVKQDRKLASVKAPTKKQEGRKEAAAEKRREKRAADSASAVEVRRIPRTAEHDADPFAAVRGALESTL